MNGSRSTKTVTIPLDVAVRVRKAFLPSNPNKLRNGSAELKAAAHAYINAVHKAEQRIALMSDCPYCQQGVTCPRHPSDQPDEPADSQAERDVIAERRRQVSDEGWTLRHDDANSSGEMAAAAACYALPEDQRHYFGRRAPDLWPWAPEHWKPKDRRRDLVRAGALIIAEIERLDRQATEEKDAVEWHIFAPAWMQERIKQCAPEALVRWIHDSEGDRLYIDEVLQRPPSGEAGA